MVQPKNRRIATEAYADIAKPDPVNAISDLPQANADNQGLIRFVTSENEPYYSNGTTWSSIAQGAQGEPGPAGAGVPSGGEPLQIVRKNSVGTTTEWATLTKSLVGLSNVDNTSDMNKPVSNIQKLALDEKLDTAALSYEVDPLNANLIGNQNSLTNAALSAAIAGEGGNLFSGLGDYEVSARQFGALGEGADETAELQAFINYVCLGGRGGVLPGKNYNITSPLEIPNARGWGVRGMGSWATQITQLTNNTPVLVMGKGGEAVNSTGFRDWKISGLTVNHSTKQSPANTNAIGMKFVAMAYEFSMTDVYYRNSYYGARVADGQACPWGSSWDDIQFSGMTGGCINFLPGINAVPNNNFGRMFVEASDATETLFGLRGYNSTISTVEIINAKLAPTLFEFATGSTFIIGSVKVEGGTYSTNEQLMKIPAGSHVQLGEFSLTETNGGFVVNPVSGIVSVFALGAGGVSPSYLRVGRLKVIGSSVVSGYVFTGSTRESQIQVDQYETSGGWLLSSSTLGSTVNENTVIHAWMNKRLSTNKGDVDVTVVPGNTETTLFFETPFTAPRRVTLPEIANDLIGGLAYTVIIPVGVVTSTNTFRFISSSRTIHTESVGGVAVTVAWRRNANGANGWVVMGRSPIS